MDRRGLEWEARGFGWLRSDLPQWREHLSAGEPSIRAMSLEGWPEETHLFIEYTYGGRTQTMDMDLWYGGYLNPPGPGQVGDDQMIATIGFSEFLENAMGVVSVPMPPTTY